MYHKSKANVGKYSSPMRANMGTVDSVRSPSSHERLGYLKSHGKKSSFKGAIWSDPRVYSDTFKYRDLGSPYVRG